MLQRFSDSENSGDYSIIKCIDFKLIYYGINLDVVSSSIVVIEFDYMFFMIRIGSLNQ